MSYINNNTPAEKHFGPTDDVVSPFTLNGGLYQISVSAGAFGTVDLQQLGPDCVTYLTVITQVVANGGQTAYLPGGTYRLLVAGVTTLYVDIRNIRIPSIV